MHRMAELGMRDRGALAHDLAHALVAGHRPFDLDRALGHAAAALQRLRRDLGPDHKAVGRRIARRDTEREWIGGKNGAAPDLTREQPAGCRDESRGADTLQQEAAIDGGETVHVEAGRKAIGHLNPRLLGLQPTIPAMTCG
jgi:hypothetical protein